MDQNDDNKKKHNEESKQDNETGYTPTGAKGGEASKQSGSAYGTKDDQNMGDMDKAGDVTNDSDM